MNIERNVIVCITVFMSLVFLSQVYAVENSACLSSYIKQGASSEEWLSEKQRDSGVEESKTPWASFEAYGIDPTWCEKEEAGYYFDTDYLRSRSGDDVKRTWVMDDYNDIDMRGSIRSIDALKGSPVHIKEDLFLHVESEQVDEEGRMERGSGEIYLGFIQEVDHPVVIKVFPAGEELPLPELYLSQFFGIIGKGPRFHGIGQDANGKYFYAMDAIEGKYKQGLKNIDPFYQKYRLYPGQVMQTSTGAQITIDPANIGGDFMNKAGEPEQLIEALMEIIQTIRRDTAEAATDVMRAA